MNGSSGSGGGGSGDRAAVSRLPLRADADSTRQVRRLLRLVLGRAGTPELADDACALATELVANALLHGRPPAELSVRVEGGGRVRIEVADASPVMPLRTRPNNEVMTGRGLALVEAVSARWGVRRVGAGKIVWADLQQGARDPAPSAGPDHVLPGRADLVTAEDALASGERRYTVHLGDVPTDLLLAAKAHVDNLVREFALASAGARAGSTAPVPAPLANLIEAVDGFADPRDAIKRQALAAANAGEDHVRLQLTMPPSAADAGEAYRRALDQADEYCRAKRLLTLESPPQHRVFRHWYVEELVTQLRHAAEGKPRVPAQTFEQRLLQEIDTVAAAQRTAERSARLYTLSATLASAVTPEAVTQAGLREGVEALRAAGGVILLATAEPTFAVSGAVGYGPPVIERLRAAPADADLPAARALRTGKAVWVESVTQRDALFPDLAGMEPSTVSMCAVPLTVGRRRLGALRFGFDEARLFDGEERDFIWKLAALTAQALDRAHLFADRVDVSRRLQRSLLPPRLPEVPGMRVGAMYEPFGDAMDVGGDFYDMWRCGEGRWAFAIGDVSGTGPEAAAMTALARHTLRALTMEARTLDLSSAISTTRCARRGRTTTRNGSAPCSRGS